MKKILYILAFIFVAIAFSSCDEYGIIYDPYPYVGTVVVTTPPRTVIVREYSRPVPPPRVIYRREPQRYPRVSERPNVNHGRPQGNSVGRNNSRIRIGRR